MSLPQFLTLRELPAYFAEDREQLPEEWDEWTYGKKLEHYVQALETGADGEVLEAIEFFLFVYDPYR